MKARTTLAGLVGALTLALGIAGCGTEPSGGKLPPQNTEISAEKAKADAEARAAAMYAKMAEPGNAGVKPPGGPPD